MPPMPLTAAIRHATAHASATGALVPITTEEIVHREGGIAYRLRWVSGLARKTQAKMPKPGDKPTDFDPFLPYEEDLFVADLSATHVALLNKFPSQEGHIVVVTRAYAEQLAPLDAGDFAAAATVLAEMDGLIFFNGGDVGGASQRHKHLQCLPVEIPIETVLPAGGPALVARTVAALPYGHRFVRFDAAPDGKQLAAAFTAAAAECGLSPREGSMPPYNLLATRRWLLLIPRQREHWEGGGWRLSINALGFAGLILVNDAAIIDPLRASGLGETLKAVAAPL